jgi:hypothetical protein
MTAKGNQGSNAAKKGSKEVGWQKTTKGKVAIKTIKTPLSVVAIKPKAKICSKCKVEKDISFFSLRTDRPGSFRSECQECARGYKRNWAAAPDNEEYRERNLARQDQLRLLVSIKIDNYLYSHPCVDCGETDIVKLQFDHVRGEKIDGVSSMERNGILWPKIEEEIAKCEVRCGNCHKKKTIAERADDIVGDSLNAKRYRERTAYFKEYLSTHPCVDCGETDTAILEFDHVRGVKEFGLSEGAHRGLSYARLDAEIAKCDTRCVNCHLLKTAIEGNFGRYLRSRAKK